MVKIDERSKRNYFGYLERHRLIEKIDSAIFENYKNIYKYYGNEVELHTNKDIKLKKDIFEADLVYVSKNKDAVLLIEETSDPTNKKDQLLAYANISPQSLKLLTGTDFIPYVDVFLVSPQNHRSTALEVFNVCKKDISSKLGKKLGLTLWYYPKSQKFFSCAGGKFSKSFPKINVPLLSKGIGAFRILKNSCHPIYLLQFIVLRAIEKYYGEDKNGIEINKEKLGEILRPYGIINEKKWTEAVNIGRHVGWFENVSLEQFAFTIKYTKLSHSSISGSKALTSNFFEAIEQEKDKKQSSLTDFFTYNSSKEENLDDEYDDTKNV